MTSEQIHAFTAAFPQALENEPMAKHTSFRLGGPARLYVAISSSDELVKAVSLAQTLGAPWYVFGGGSNLLVSDEGFDGVMIQAAHRRIAEHGTPNTEHGTVHLFEVEAGALSVFVARKTVDAGLAGFEWAVGLPGTIGGAIYGNAGCFGGEMRQAVLSVDTYRLADGKRVTLANAECQFAYRDSLFKREPHLILGCVLRLAPAADPVASKHTMEDILRARKDKQPLGSSSAGCAFKNYEFSDERALEILRRQVDEIPADMLRHKRLSAGWLIEQVGLKGYRLGNMQVSDKHANFLLNLGQARAQDAVALISLIKMKVRDELGIELADEVQTVGW